MGQPSYKNLLIYGMEDSSINVGLMLQLYLFHSLNTRNGQQNAAGGGMGVSGGHGEQNSGEEIQTKKAVGTAVSGSPYFSLSQTFSILIRMLEKARNTKLPISATRNTTGSSPDLSKIHQYLHRGTFLPGGAVMFDSAPMVTRVVKHTETDYIAMIFWISDNIVKKFTLPESMHPPAMMEYLWKDFAERNNLLSTDDIFYPDGQEIPQFINNGSRASEIQALPIKTDVLRKLQAILERTRKAQPPVMSETRAVYQILYDFLYRSSQSMVAPSKQGKSSQDFSSSDSGGVELFDLWETICFIYIKAKYFTNNPNWKIYAVDDNNLPEQLFSDENFVGDNKENCLLSHGVTHPDRLSFLGQKRPDLILVRTGENGYFEEIKIIDFKHYDKKGALINIICKLWDYKHPRPCCDEKEDVSNINDYYSSMICHLDKCHCVCECISLIFMVPSMDTFPKSMCLRMVSKPITCVEEIAWEENVRGFVEDFHNALIL